MSNRPNKHLLVEGKFETELLCQRTHLPRVDADQRCNGLGICGRAIWALVRELASNINPQIQLESMGLSLLLGEIMIGFGDLLTALAGWRYHIVNPVIEMGKIKADRGMVVSASIIVVATVMGSFFISFLPPLRSNGADCRCGLATALARETFAWHNTTLARFK